MLPATWFTRFFWVAEISTLSMCAGIMRAGLSSDVTRKKSPTVFPVSGSKRMPYTLLKLSWPQRK
jgi:hypothetical protein